MMAHKTLLEQLDDIQFSDAAHALAEQLSRHSATDEMGVVVLTAATTLIARECPGQTAASIHKMARLSDEFAEIVIRMHIEIHTGLASGPDLRIVGGTDLGGAA